MVRKLTRKEKIQKESERWSLIVDRDNFSGDLEITLSGESPNIKINLEFPKKFEGHSVYNLSGLGDNTLSRIYFLAHVQNYDCDLGKHCEYPKSAHTCYTENFKGCYYYKLIKKNLKREI